jgi:hypothetical protein
MLLYALIAATLLATVAADDDDSISGMRVLIIDNDTSAPSRAPHHIPFIAGMDRTETSRQRLAFLLELLDTSRTSVNTITSDVPLTRHKRDRCGCNHGCDYRGVLACVRCCTQILR